VDLPGLYETEKISGSNSHKFRTNSSVPDFGGDTSQAKNVLPHESFISLANDGLLKLNSQSMILEWRNVRPIPRSP